MKGVAPLHGKPTAYLFPSPEHRVFWETKRALTLSVDDEFPGTLQTMVASQDFPGTQAAKLASKRPLSSLVDDAPPPPPPPLPLPPTPALPTPMAVDEGSPLLEGPPLPDPPSVDLPSSTSVFAPPTATSVVSQPPSATAVVAPPAPTKRRAQLARLPSAVLVCLVLVELWAGVASLSTSFMDAGHSLFAFCEANPLLHSLLSLIHPDSLTSLKSELGEWKDWIMPTDGVVWLIGGPSCNSLSTAGKQLAQNDPNSRYRRDHIAIAAACGALLILLENVPFLVEGDGEHGLYSHLLQQAAALGYTLSQMWFVRAK